MWLISSHQSKSVIFAIAVTSFFIFVILFMFLSLSLSFLNSSLQFILNVCFSYTYVPRFSPLSHQRKAALVTAWTIMCYSTGKLYCVLKPQNYLDNYQGKKFFFFLFTILLLKKKKSSLEKTSETVPVTFQCLLYHEPQGLHLINCVAKIISIKYFWTC